MKDLFKIVAKNSLFKVASANSLSMLIKMVGGFMTSKFLAIYVGAEGMALFGNLRDFMNSIQAVSTLGLYNGLVKYVSEFKDNMVALSKALSTIFYVGFFSVLMVAISLYYNVEYINKVLFDSRFDYTYLLKIFIIGLPFYALNLMCLGILNGYKKFKILIVLNIIAHILGTLLTLFLIWFNRIEGALLALVLIESLVFLVTLIALIYQKSLIGFIKIEQFSFKVLKKLSSYSIMALFSAFTLPLITLTIRDYITDNVGLKEAGFWEAMTRISRYYLMFITTLLSLYILPRFSEIKDKYGFKVEVLKFYKTILPLFCLGLLAIYMLRDYIILIMYNETFKPVSQLFLWQLLGDVFKVMSLVISFQFLAKRMFWEYMITEVFSFFVLYYVSLYFIDIYGVEGASMAHLFNYFTYFCVILFVFRKSLFFKVFKKNPDENL